eukprot:6227006-Prymnesium_polylepis.1
MLEALAVTEAADLSMEEAVTATVASLVAAASAEAEGCHSTAEESTEATRCSMVVQAPQAATMPEAETPLATCRGAEAGGGWPVSTVRQ